MTLGEFLAELSAVMPSNRTVTLADGSVPILIEDGTGTRWVIVGIPRVVADVDLDYAKRTVRDFYRTHRLEPGAER